MTNTACLAGVHPETGVDSPAKFIQDKVRNLIRFKRLFLRINGHLRFTLLRCFVLLWLVACSMFTYKRKSVLYTFCDSRLLCCVVLRLQFVTFYCVVQLVLKCYSWLYIITYNSILGKRKQSQAAKKGWEGHEK